MAPSILNLGIRYRCLSASRTVQLTSGERCNLAHWVEDLVYPEADLVVKPLAWPLY